MSFKPNIINNKRTTENTGNPKDDSNYHLKVISSGGDYQIITSGHTYRSSKGSSNELGTESVSISAVTNRSNLSGLRWIVNQGNGGQSNRSGNDESSGIIDNNIKSTANQKANNNNQNDTININKVKDGKGSGNSDGGNDTKVVSNSIDDNTGETANAGRSTDGTVNFKDNKSVINTSDRGVNSSVGESLHPGTDSGTSQRDKKIHNYRKGHDSHKKKRQGSHGKKCLLMNPKGAPPGTWARVDCSHKHRFLCTT